MIIAVDMDDTIENLIVHWLDKLNKKFGYNVKNEDVVTWDIIDYYPGLTSNDITSVIKEDDFWKGVTPKQDAIKYIKKLITEGNEVYILTSSYYRGLIGKMDDCLFKWFPYLTWDHVIVTSHKELIACDVIIDDNELNVETSKATIKIVYDTPHSHEHEFGDVIYASDWEFIYNLLTAPRENF